MKPPDEAARLVASETSHLITESEPPGRDAAAITAGSSPPFVGGPAERAMLRIKRDTWGGRLLSFHVSLGGVFVGKLAHAQTLEVQIRPGVHLLEVWGAGALFGNQVQFLAQPYELCTYTVCYSWYGGV